MSDEIVYKQGFENVATDSSNIIIAWEDFGNQGGEFGQGFLWSTPVSRIWVIYTAYYEYGVASGIEYMHQAVTGVVPHEYYISQIPILSDLCDEPLVYGANILNDPDFENHIFITSGAGPNGNQFPFTPGSSQAPYYVGSGQLSTGVSGWNFVAGSGVVQPLLSTADPAVGSYHFRATTANTSGTAQTYAIVPTKFYTCGPVTNTTYYPISARVEVGDTVQFSIKAKYSTTGSGTATLRFRHYFARYADGIPVNTGFPTLFPDDSHTLTTSYATYSAQSFVAPSAPADAHYYVIEMIFIKSTTGSPETMTFDADSAQLTVLQA